MFHNVSGSEGCPVFRFLRIETLFPRQFEEELLPIIYILPIGIRVALRPTWTLKPIACLGRKHIYLLLTKTVRNYSFVND